MSRRSALSARGFGLLGIALLVALTASVAPGVSAATQKKKSGETMAKPTGAPLLWKDPGDISKLDLYWGAGSEATAPKPPFKFVKEDVSGTNPKIKVTDAAGKKWNMKFAEEVHAEVACSRIVWALGYLVEESYFMASVKVDGVTGLGRAAKYVSKDGTATNVMFEARPENIERTPEWDWDSNPFAGTKELSGLAMVAVMLNNWDAKTTNNARFMVTQPDGTVQQWYLVADWGGTLGKMGGVFSHSKWDPEAFQKQGFIDRVSGSTLKLDYSGKGGRILQGVPVDHAKWFAGMVGQLSDAQLSAAFKAAGASSSETSAFVGKIRQKISSLKAAVH